MSFTLQEKARILHFGSYPEWVSLASSIQLGFPAATQPLFLIEDSFNRLTVNAEISVRIDLGECECIEKQMSQARTRFATRKVGEVEFNPDEIAMLRGEMMYWITRLMDDLGVVPNPYAQAIYNGIGGGINARVIG